MKKNGRVFIKSFRALVLLLMPLTLLMAGISQGATVNVYLRAGVTTIPAGAYSAVPLVPNEAITMWGYAQCTSATFVTCGPVTVPGPVLTATEGDTLNITVRNNLTGPITEPTSVVIPGQTPSVMSPVWIDSTGAVVSTGSRLPGDTTSRMRSLNTETPVGGTVGYSWVGVKPGTYLYESGTHQAVQVQMGLYGALKVNSLTAGQAYDDPSTAFNSEVTLLYSEIDPELHYSIASGGYGTPQVAPPAPPVRGYMTSTVNYRPRFFLINGTPYLPGSHALAAGTPGQKTLIRFLNAGLLEKTPTVTNNYMTLIAEDANLLPYSKLQYSTLLPAGKTMDVLLMPTAAGTIAVYDRGLNLTNAGVSPGGLLTYLQVGGFNPSTIGVFRPSAPTTFYLRNSNTAGAPDIVAQYGNVGDMPIVGDWDGNGTTTIGVYRPSNQRFLLRNSNTTGVADINVQYGNSGDIPIVGDWDGNGTTTIGVYRPSNQRFLLRNSNTTGVADINAQYGNSGDIPIVGDWDGNGTTTIGVYRPGNRTFFLKNSNTTGAADVTIHFNLIAQAGDIPVAGDWDGDGRFTVGVYRPGNQTFYLSNVTANNSTPASADITVQFGNAGDIPVVGDWNGLP